ncbi:PAH-inducible cytochrome P450 monooxygenase PC-PAH 4 [Trametes maxima]|nr:PAH-inducible cytochrome P450 monooxygenase PC-PAH 4 [Trametes maxima]
MLSPVTAGLLALSVLIALVGVFRRRSIKHIRGPPTKSRLLGHDYDLNRQDEVGDLEFSWLREYGPTWRVRGALGADGLMTADPKALQHIYQKAGANYVKKPSQNHASWIVTGPGIAWSQGEAHTRHRRIMSPAFSAARLKSFLPLFQRIGSKLVEKWKTQLMTTTGPVELMVDAWLSRATLDIIGEAAFDYDYGALDQADQSVLAKEYHGIFKDMDYRLPKSTLLFRATWDYLPWPLLKLFRYIPANPFTRMRNLNSLFAAYGKQILREKRPEFDAEKSTNNKDIMSILIKANESSDAKTRLDDEELLAEMFTLTLAGHETTATTLTFLLYELARNPEYQARLRQEIRQVHARVTERGASEFTVEDLDSIPSLLNAIKETLRIHPIASLLPRVAVQDDVIPLAHPITTTTGEVISEIPISKGQVIVTSFAAYQRLTQVWGEDAHVWNPDRFTRIDVGKQTNVGVFANLMTFSAGPHSCIGWRFSVIEQQALVAELVSAFQFELPAGTDAKNTEVVRAPSGTSMVPIVRGKPELGAGLRLQISFAP